MDFVEQKTVKLLALAARQSAAALAEALCLTPDKRLVKAMLTDVRAMLDEFEEHYFADDDAAANGTAAGGTAGTGAGARRHTTAAGADQA